VQIFAVHEVEVGLQIDLTETVVVVIRDTAFDEQVAHLILGFQVIDQVLAERQLAQIAVLRGQPLRQLLDARGDFPGRDAARGADIVEIALPDIIHPVQVGGLRFR